MQCPERECDGIQPSAILPEGGRETGVHVTRIYHHPPILKQAVVAVGHQQVSDPVDPLLSQLGALEREALHAALRAQVVRREALHQVLLHAACRRHQARD